MLLFGFILVLLGVGAGAFAIWVAMAGVSQAAADGTAGLGVSVLGNTIVVQTLNLVLLGIAAILLTLFGLWLMMAASKRKVRLAKERRDLKKTQKQQEKELAETRRRLGEEQSAREGHRHDDHRVGDHRVGDRRHDEHVDDTGRRDDTVVDGRDHRPVADGTEYHGGSTAGGRHDDIPPVDGHRDRDVR